MAIDYQVTHWKIAWGYNNQERRFSVIFSNHYDDYYQRFDIGNTLVFEKIELELIDNLKHLI